MQFQHYDLGHRNAGEIVEVTLSGNAANVRLMDSSNYSSFRSGRSHRYQGGLAKRSPVRLLVPRSGHWHVTVDLGGLRGQVRSGIQVLPGALPPLQERPLASVPSLVHEEPPHADGISGTAKQYDVFISHASEDKDAIVRPLAHALREQGLQVWFDEFELRIGSSLRKTIDRGIANSRFGIIVLSKTFFSKGWPAYELDGLVTKAVSGEQVLLPIWHEVTKQEVVAYSPSIADKLARSTATRTVEEIAEEIARVIRGEPDSD